VFDRSVQKKSLESRSFREDSGWRSETSAAFERWRALGVDAVLAARSVGVANAARRKAVGNGAGRQSAEALPAGLAVAKLAGHAVPGAGVLPAAFERAGFDVCVERGFALGVPKLGVGVGARRGQGAVTRDDGERHFELGQHPGRGPPSARVERGGALLVNAVLAARPVGVRHAARRKAVGNGAGRQLAEALPARLCVASGFRDAVSGARVLPAAL